MNTVSRLYGECFTNQLGDWCREHGVEYIGHVIEDNDCHTRLGYSCGHFFRALWGQDMSGIDVVLWQIRPGFDRHSFAWPGPEPADGEFFHYELAKLGASLAHLDPKKQGRAMCEIFGAYGWAEGLKLMKWLTDHMLVRGINWFVPHAFSPAPFPDPDCPPHFYAHGLNPQYRYMRHLMDYTNRLCHLLNGGQHVAQAAVVYHAEAEWSGAYMSVKEPLRELMQEQFDADIVPVDLLSASTRLGNGRIHLGGEAFECLIFPWAELWPLMALEFAVSAASAGVRVLFVDALPIGVSEAQAHTGQGPAGTVLQALRALHVRGALGNTADATVCVCNLGELAGQLRAWGISGPECDARLPYLRSYHYRHPAAGTEGPNARCTEQTPGGGTAPDADTDAWMLFNEHPSEAVSCRVRPPAPQRESGGVRMAEGGPSIWRVYDAFANVLREASAVAGDGYLNLDLSPYESVVLVRGEGADDMAGHLAAPRDDAAGWAEADHPSQLVIEPCADPTGEILFAPSPPPSWRISTASALEYPAFTPCAAAPTVASRFAGTVRYQAAVSFPGVAPGAPATLDLGDVGETAEVRWNDSCLGLRLCRPYRFVVPAALMQAVNEVVIDVTTAMGHEQHDGLSAFSHLESVGLIGPVVLRVQG